ncbi:unnamed protein product [Triticum turgidum subsp. durum]|uniref:FAD synthase n=1 Tax=Triticum turgidum subsp. durum TaxID=4567 RepID=A0A9R0X8N3_TRITD|nr:unnamed protein product [Triticum turgidum subsp. durum]
MERGCTAALACTFRSSSSPSPVSHCPPLLRPRGRPPAAAGAPHFLPPTGRRFSYCSQNKFLDTSKGLKRYSLKTFSPFGRPGVSLNDADLVKDKMLIDCGEEQDCVLDGIVALGKFDALHIGHRELAMHASKSGNPFLLSFVGMAEVLGWEYS